MNNEEQLSAAGGNPPEKMTEEQKVWLREMEEKMRAISEHEQKTAKGQPVAAASPYNPELERRFTYHAPKSNQVARYERIRTLAKEFAYVIDHICPDSREKSLAWTHLEDAVYCANAAIARNE